MPPLQPGEDAGGDPHAEQRDEGIGEMSLQGRVTQFPVRLRIAVAVFGVTIKLACGGIIPLHELGIRDALVGFEDQAVGTDQFRVKSGYPERRQTNFGIGAG